MSDTQAPPPQVEAHDPLPEANWLWRRVFTFVFVTVMLLGMVGVGWQMHELATANGPVVIEKLYGMFRYMTLLTFISVTYYMVAPSAEQVTRMWQTAAMFKQGIGTTITQTAQGADGSKATATTTTGPMVVPPTLQKPLERAPENSGLPDNRGTYTGPPTNAVPEAHPDLPKDVPWAAH